MKFAILSVLSILTVGSMSFASVVCESNTAAVMIESQGRSALTQLALPQQRLNLYMMGALDSNLSFLRPGNVLRFENAHIIKTFTVTNSQVTGTEGTSLMNVETFDKKTSLKIKSQTDVRIGCVSSH